MKTIFEEYGKVILAIIAVALLLGLIFGGIHLYEVLGKGADAGTVFNHSESEEAVKQAADRNAPTISIADTDDLHLYVDRVFNPVATVSCVDNDGVAVAVSVTSMVFTDATGTQKEVVGSYDAEADELDVPNVLKEPGVLSVTFQAIDSYNITAIKTISYVVDAVAG